jgi:hypothetical protein
LLRIFPHSSLAPIRAWPLVPRARVLRGYEGLARTGAAVPSYLARTRDRLVRLYEAWGKTAEAARWRARQPGEGA